MLFVINPAGRMKWIDAAPTFGITPQHYIATADGMTAVLDSTIAAPCSMIAGSTAWQNRGTLAMANKTTVVSVSGRHGGCYRRLLPAVTGGRISPLIQ